MKAWIITACVGTTAAVAGFAAGDLYRRFARWEVTPLLLQDQALQIVRGHFAVAHFLSSGDVEQARDLSDTFINSGLSSLAASATTDSSPEFERAKVKTLNGVALLWEKHPPFKDAEWRDGTHDWAKEWEAGFQKNMALLRWAQAECRLHPEYECKTK